MVTFFEARTLGATDLETTILRPDLIDALVERALERLSDGETPARIEVERVDFKEERGRRRRDGTVSPGAATNEPAAAHPSNI